MLEYLEAIFVRLRSLVEPVKCLGTHGFNGVSEFSPIANAATYRSRSGSFSATCWQAGSQAAGSPGGTS